MVKKPPLIRLWFSINGRIHICLFISLIGMAGIMVFSFVSSWSAAYNEAYRFFHAAEDELSTRIKKSLRDYEDAARRAGYSSAVQRYLLSDNPETVIFSYNAAYGVIADALHTSAGIQNIFIAADNGRYLCANRSFINEIREEIAAYRLTGNVVIPKPFFTVKGQEDKERLLFYFFPVYNILSIGRSNSSLCVLVCDMKQITRINPADSGDREDAAILSFNGMVVSSSRGLNPNEYTSLPDIRQGRSRTIIGKDGYLTVKVSLSEQLWDFIYIISEQVIRARVFSLMNKGLFFLCAVILSISVILVWILRSVNVSISALVKDMDALEYGQGFRTGGPHLREIEEISHTASLMLERMNSAFLREQQAKQKLIDAVTAQAQAEFISYRTQINPHFLFNTLECMRSMAHSRHDEALETMISSMSQMFRYSLYAQAIVCLEQELDHVRHFVNVINIRYGGKYRLCIHADEASKKRTVLSMILQPLVENAIYHAFTEKEQGQHTVLVQARCNDENSPLLIRVADNGAGLSPEELETIEGQSGIKPGRGETKGALYNINKRMKLCFGEDFCLRIKSKKDFYTVVELRIPPRPELVLAGIK